MIESISNGVMVVALLAIAAWEARQLASRPDDAALRLLVAGLIVLALTVALQAPLPFLAPVEEALESVGFSNAAWTFMAYCYATFFLLADNTRQWLAKRRQLMIEATYCAAFLVLVYVMWFAVLDWGVLAKRAYNDFSTWQGIIWWGLYSVVDISFWTIGTVRAAALWRRVSLPWTRAALTIVAIGATGMALGPDAMSALRRAIYTVHPGAELPWVSTIYNIGRIGGQLCLALGLALVPIGTGISRARSKFDQRFQRKYVRRIAPLWRRLTSEFPEIVLPARRVGFARVAAEITDGLAQLAPYAPRTETDGRDPRSRAQMVATAFERRAGHRGRHFDPASSTVAEPPYPQIEPDFGDDWRRRARWMAELSDALCDLGVCDHRPGDRTGDALTEEGNQVVQP